MKLKKIYRQIVLCCTALALPLSLQVAAQEIPPETWQEHWFEHNQLVTRVYYDDDVAVYYDNEVDRNIT